jgi:pyruvate dehydrogenase E1 component
VILAKTVKGWTLGQGFEGRNATHQIKKMTKASSSLELRERLHLHDEIPERHQLDADEPALLPARRGLRSSTSTCGSAAAALGGPLPKSHGRCDHPPPPAAAGRVDAPFDERASPVREASEVSTTMAFTRLLREPDARAAEFGRARRADHPRRGAHVRHGLAVPRVRDLRTRSGQQYEPVDHDLLLSYTEEHVDGQILEEGITEAGSMASFIAAATSATPPAACRWCPSTPSIRCSGSSGSGDLIWAGSPTPAPAASSWAPPPVAPR